MPRIYEDTSDSATDLISPEMREGLELALKSKKSLVTYSPSKKKADRDKIVQAMEETFELIGGVPRLALWANENPGKFYALWSRNASKEQNKTVTNNIRLIRPSIPPSPLDGDPSILEGEFIEHSDPELCAETPLSSIPCEK
jgi:hypothetical protein